MADMASTYEPKQRWLKLVQVTAMLLTC